MIEKIKKDGSVSHYLKKQHKPFIQLRFRIIQVSIAPLGLEFKPQRGDRPPQSV